MTNLKTSTREQISAAEGALTDALGTAATWAVYDFDKDIISAKRGEAIKNVILEAPNAFQRRLAPDGETMIYIGAWIEEDADWMMVADIMIHEDGGAQFFCICTGSIEDMSDMLLGSTAIEVAA